MTSEIRANTLKNRVGLGTVSFTNTGIVVSGIVTANSFSGTGDLDVDGHTNLDNVSVAGVSTHSDHIHLLDDKRLRLGSAVSGDAVLLHDGTDTILDNQTGNLFFRSGSTHLQSLSGEDKIVAEANGAVGLYYDNSLKLITTSTGINVTGNISVAGNITPSGTLYLSDAIEHIDDSNTKIRFPGNDQITFETDGSERLRIRADGKLLLGTTDATTIGTVNKTLVIGSTTNNDEVALTLNVMEGVNGRRVKFFLDDDDGVFGIDSTASSGVPPFVLRGAGTERVRITSDGYITTTQSIGNIGIDLHATGSGRGSQIKFHNDHGVAYIGQAGDTSGNFLLYNETNTPMLFYSGTVNTLILYSSREARFSGYVVAQTMGSGTSANVASLQATQSGMNSDTYNYILSGSNDVGNKCTMFVNGSARSTDGGANTLTFRNDGGNLRLGHSSFNTNILGNLTLEQPIINQQTKFQYSNSGGVGAYLSLFNTSATAGSSTGISFGIGNSDAQLDGSDWGEGQIKVFTDSGQYGNMEFNIHVNANRSFMKIVGNGQAYGGAGAGAEGQRGGVAFGNAGIAIDRSWTGQPGIHVFNENVEGDTDQGTFRFHGWNTSYASYPGRSGSDFGVNVTGDGSGFSSDERKKTGIATITNALNTVAQLRGVSYKFVNSELTPQTHMTMDSGTKLGFVAQEVIPLLPSIVIDAGGEKAVPLENGWCDRYCIDYGSVTALLTEAIKELKAKNEALEARIAVLEG